MAGPGGAGLLGRGGIVCGRGAASGALVWLDLELLLCSWRWSVDFASVR